jgi:hypothetical protein
MFAVGLLSALIAEASPRIGVFSQLAERADNRISGLGYPITNWTTPSQISLDALNGVDVLYVATANAFRLSEHAGLIAQWVELGNGLILEQPNVEGPVAIMPPGLGVSVFSRSYDGSQSMDDPVRAILITPAGADHPITAGLSTASLTGNADRVRRADVSVNFDILGVQITNPDYVALAAATYGDGRVVFHTGNIDPLSHNPGSDQYLRQMLDWAAVPEPRSLTTLMLAAVFTIPCRRCRRSIKPQSRLSCPARPLK